MIRNVSCPSMLDGYNASPKSCLALEILTFPISDISSRVTKQSTNASGRFTDSSLQCFTNNPIRFCAPSRQSQLSFTRPRRKSSPTRPSRHSQVLLLDFRCWPERSPARHCSPFKHSHRQRKKGLTNSHHTVPQYHPSRVS
jgi:hypothetical protein